jgi:hypothetical protein
MDGMDLMDLMDRMDLMDAGREMGIFLGVPWCR